MKNITKAANKIIEQLESLGYTDEKPTLTIKVNKAVIAWEAGPREWTIDGYGLFEELKGYGMPGEYSGRELYTVPEGYEAEPKNGSVLVLFKS